MLAPEAVILGEAFHSDLSIRLQPPFAAEQRSVTKSWWHPSNKIHLTCCIVCLFYGMFQGGMPRIRISSAMTKHCRTAGLLVQMHRVYRA
jgi:hypothetical protein